MCWNAMKIATWNVNSIKARLPRVLEWLEEAQPDVVLLQEIKTIDDTFPTLEIAALGYTMALHGQKTYNGVAILSRHPIEDIKRGLPGDSGDEQARYIEATIKGLRVASIYLPNGNPAPSEKYDYKLAWMRRLIARTTDLLRQEKPFLLGGDYNVCPDHQDVYDPAGWQDDALFRLQSRETYRELLNLGLTDAFRTLVPIGHNYTFWDYQAGAWQKDHGLRIDHLLLSPQAADRLKACAVDRAPRGRERASDHTPVWCELDI